MSGTLTKERTISKDRILEPKKYKVLLMNDNSTPMDFVVAMFMEVFKHQQDVAVNLTLKIHNEGSAVAGIYSYEIAEQKTYEATNLAKEHGFPLVIKSEPV